MLTLSLFLFYLCGNIQLKMQIAEMKNAIAAQEEKLQNESFPSESSDYHPIQDVSTHLPTYRLCYIDIILYICPVYFNLLIILKTKILVSTDDRRVPRFSSIHQGRLHCSKKGPFRTR